jgi:hypothetical protein
MKTKDLGVAHAPKNSRFLAMTLTRIPIDFAKDYNYKPELTPPHSSSPVTFPEHLNPTTLLAPNIRSSPV